MGYKKHEITTGVNSRNDSTGKTLIAEDDPAQLNAPRDREVR